MSVRPARSPPTSPPLRRRRARTTAGSTRRGPTRPPPWPRPAARGSAPARTEQARAQADRAVAPARSSAGRFLALLAEADRARGLTVRLLYLDALRELLPRVRRKLVLTPEEPVDLSILKAEDR